MPKHGTAFQWSLGQHTEVLEMVIRQLPRALEGLNPKMVIQRLGHCGQNLERELRGALINAAKLTYPADDEPFTLATARGARMFQLVRIGSGCGLIEAREKLAARGKEVNSRILIEFASMHPHPDGKGPIGCTGDCYLGPLVDRTLVYLDVCGGLHTEPCYGFDESWRWLVEMPRANERPEAVR